MQLFGGFVLYNQRASVDEKSLHSNKLIKLLVYILLHRERNLDHQELIDTFWQNERSRNPEGALKNLVYRLRNELKVLGEGDLILTLPGAYHWNPDVIVETDYEQFERIAKMAKGMERTPRKAELCREAMKIYRKEVPPCIAVEQWMISILTYYRLLYFETAKELAEIYAENESWEELEAMCRKVLETDTLDEDMNYWLIKSQIGKKNYDLALEYYENAKRIFYDNLGIRESERFNQVYDEILSLSDNHLADMNEVMSLVNEKKRPREAFMCEYPVFREIYRIEARRARRTGIAEYVLLITLKKQGNRNDNTLDDRLRTGMQILENVLRNTLRIGDVTARYSSTQYVLLLSTCTYEAALIVAERLQKAFHSAAGKRRLVLQFEIEELQDAEEWNGGR